MPYNIIVNIDKKIVFNVRSKLENRVKDCEKRMIPLNRKLKEILIAITWRDRFIFFIQSGATWKNNLSPEFQKVVSAAGLQDVGIQVMRETFGNHLLRKGVSITLFRSTSDIRP